MSKLDIRDIKKSAEPTPDRLPPEVGIYHVSFRSPEGDLDGEIKIKVLDGDESLKVQRRSADLAGCPWDHIPPAGQIRILALSTLAFAVVSAPDWFYRWVSTCDDLLFHVFRVCQEHADRYFRGNLGEGPEAKIKPLVVVRPAGDT